MQKRTSPLKILLIEDEEALHFLLKQKLSNTQIPINIIGATGWNSGMEALKQEKPDLILLDLGLTDSGTEQTLERIPEIANDYPVIVLTGLDSQNAWSKAIKLGACDYLIKQLTLDTVSDVWFFHAIWNAILIHRREHGKTA